ncbi:ABC transporter ATP-binding protein [Novispirillum itersonii]|uniref:ABC transporter ATP-binding protein n=1 Tax=Novispirillum itersonii TaxID=189 RepID=UPI000375B66E|nr:ABC transporter ATP-binding protein [Novispirillum itersonii]
MLTAETLGWGLRGRAILDGISLTVQAGEFVGLIGPNGSGKSSLLALLAGLRRPDHGTVRLDGIPLPAIPRRLLAQRLALVEQQAQTQERVTVRHVAGLGRTPHLGAFTPWSPQDTACVDQALAAVDLLDLADRDWGSLSGGERQRAHIARALAQQPELLLLDEPTNHLDIAHQLSLLDLVRQQGLTVVAALHDLNHAALFCDRIAVLHHGRLDAFGPPAEILTPDRLRRVFAVDAVVDTDADGLCHIRYRVPRRPAVTAAVATSVEKELTRC